MPELRRRLQEPAAICSRGRTYLGWDVEGAIGDVHVPDDENEERHACRGRWRKRIGRLCPRPASSMRLARHLGRAPCGGGESCQPALRRRLDIAIALDTAIRGPSWAVQGQPTQATAESTEDRVADLIGARRGGDKEFFCTPRLAAAAKRKAVFVPSPTSLTKHQGWFDEEHDASTQWRRLRRRRRRHWLKSSTRSSLRACRASKR